MVDSDAESFRGKNSAQYDAEEEIKEKDHEQPLTLQAHRRDKLSLNEAEEDRRHYESAQERNAYDLVLSFLFRHGLLLAHWRQVAGTADVAVRGSCYAVRKRSMQTEGVSTSSVTLRVRLLRFSFIVRSRLW
jgi:hypothetical protein